MAIDFFDEGHESDFCSSTAEEASEHAVAASEFVFDSVEDLAKADAGGDIEFLDECGEFDAGLVDVADLGDEVLVALGEVGFFFDGVEVDITEFFDFVFEDMDAGGHGCDIDAVYAAVVHHVAVLGVFDDQIDFEVFECAFFDGFAFDLGLSA